MRKILFIMAVIVFASVAESAFVVETTARQVAENWFANRSPLEAKGRKIEKSFVTKNQDLPVFYTYGFENGGFVIVSADDAAEPIIGYSYTSPITEEINHPAVKSWFDNYSSQIYEISAKKSNNAKTLPMWEKILRKDFDSFKNGKAVLPLLKTQWDQGSPYDMYVPNLPNGGKCAVGCVATAMAQVMNYYQWPITGQGSNTYTPSITGTPLTANFGATTYEWSRTLDGKTTTGSPAGAKHAVALLSLHSGISVDMMYGESSGAYSADALWALKNNFRYKQTATMKYRSSYSSTWDILLKAELDLNRPLYYSGSGTGGGHAFVCDGYQDADNKFHFNWGWSGSYDGYFASNALNPEGTGTGGGTGGFNNSQQAFFGLWDYSTKPVKVTDLSVRDVGNGSQVQIRWKKNTESNLVKYKVSIGTVSYNYSSVSFTTDTVVTISNLTTGTQYFIGVTALDLENDESKVAELSCTPQIFPTTPLQLTALPGMQNVDLIWNANSEMDLSGYNIYKSSNNIDFTKVNTNLITEPHYLIINPAHDSYSYFKVSSVDDNGNESVLSSSISARPVTLDQGVLIVDESSNGSGTATSPDDAMQDQFYNAVTANVANKTSFDALVDGAGKVTLSDIGPYSSVIWHNQAVELGSTFNTNLSEIKKYLDFGGKILVVADKPGKLIETNNSYPMDFSESSIAQSYFGIDSAFYKAAARCNGAVSLAGNGYNNLVVDTTKTIATNGEHIKKLETLKAASGANVIYTYNSGYEITNTWGTEKGKPLGLEKLTSGYKTVTLAVPLYFIKQDDARMFVEYVLSNKFGETVDINEAATGQISTLSLFQNYPNPFNPTTTISFFNPQDGAIKLVVYNVKGEMVKELINGFTKSGLQNVKFDASGLNSGMYFYKVSSKDKDLTGKMVLLK